MRGGIPRIIWEDKIERWANTVKKNNCGDEKN